MILIKTDRVHSLRQKAATVWIDKPENSVIFSDAEISFGIKNAGTRPAPPRS
jgi:hypothetical protein